ncbi:MAG TPA: CpsD/CapB family tyrosine-protein kinase [Candidatus Blautia excrementipullorum]|nr:CpsD/CapB family tyrosine-protein kinase [Candidatus Blautia excrementipullorum]
MKNIELKDIRKQDYFYSEAIKTLRTNIQLSGKSIKTILVTSCYPNEGKSDIAISLAQELGSIGKKVLLVDADIRKSSYISHFQVEQEVHGLSEFLSGQIEVKDLIYNTNYPNMNIIFGGPVAPDPSGLFSDNLFRTFLKEIRNYYDYILIDTPPVGTIIDAAVIARYSDGAVFVIEQGSVSYKVAQKAIRQLEKSSCRILGAVLNKADTEHDKYYRKYGDYYQKLNKEQQTQD